MQRVDTSEEAVEEWTEQLPTEERRATQEKIMKLGRRQRAVVLERSLIGAKDPMKVVAARLRQAEAQQKRADGLDDFIERHALYEHRELEDALLQARDDDIEFLIGPVANRRDAARDVRSRLRLLQEKRASLAEFIDSHQLFKEPSLERELLNAPTAAVPLLTDSLAGARNPIGVMWGRMKVVTQRAAAGQLAGLAAPTAARDRRELPPRNGAPVRLPPSSLPPSSLVTTAATTTTTTSAFARDIAAFVQRFHITPDLARGLHRVPPALLPDVMRSMENARNVNAVLASRLSKAGVVLREEPALPPASLPSAAPPPRPPRDDRDRRGGSPPVREGPPPPRERKEPRLPPRRERSRSASSEASIDSVEKAQLYSDIENFVAQHVTDQDVAGTLECRLKRTAPSSVRPVLEKSMDDARDPTEVVTRRVNQATAAQKVSTRAHVEGFCQKFGCDDEVCDALLHLPRARAREYVRTYQPRGVTDEERGNEILTATAGFLPEGYKPRAARVSSFVEKQDLYHTHAAKLLRIMDSSTLLRFMRKPKARGKAPTAAAGEADEDAAMKEDVSHDSASREGSVISSTSEAEDVEARLRRYVRTCTVTRDSETTSVGLEMWPNSLRVKRVMPGSPAAEAGIRSGVRLLAVDGHVVHRVTDMRRAMEGHLSFTFDTTLLT